MPFPPSAAQSPKPSTDGAMDPADPELKSAASFVDEILGIPSPGSSTPATSTGATPNLKDSMPSGGTEPANGNLPPVGEQGMTEEGKSADMGPILAMVDGDAEAANKLYAASQKRPQLEGKTPTEVAAALRADLQLRLDLMAEVAEGDDMAEQQRTDAMLPPVKTPQDIMNIQAPSNPFAKPMA